MNLTPFRWAPIICVRDAARRLARLAVPWAFGCNDRWDRAICMTWSKSASTKWPTSDPRVVLYSLDPERFMSPIVQRLKNFDEWLEYAKRDAANYRIENPDEFEEESK